MNTPILNAIKQLLELKGSCTYAELAGVAEVKKIKVIEVLNANKDLLVIKEGKITQIVNTDLRQQRKAYTEGKSYSFGNCNYGCQETIDTNNPIANDLKESYWCGGMGDCYKVEVILKTEENIKKIEALGLVYWDQVPTFSFAQLWKE